MKNTDKFLKPMKKILCPNCECVNDPSEVYSDDDTFEVECCNCDTVFEVTSYVEITFSIGDVIDED